jgi:uncharacterized protein with beta-barrel porin domain
MVRARGLGTAGMVVWGFRHPCRVRRAFLSSTAVASTGLAAAAFAVAALLPGAAAAQNATWLLNPTVAGPTASTFDYNASANWTPATVPTGTAFFGVSNGPNLSFSAGTTIINGWTFNAGASAYAFTNAQDLVFLGAGIVINGGSATITNNFGFASFVGASTAGSATITNNRGGGVGFGSMSTAGNATINNNAFGSVTFTSTSTAGNATITNAGISSTVQFFNTSTAGSAAITNNDSTVRFSNTSTAGSAAITNNNSGSVQYFDTSTAGSAAITNNDNGVVTFRNTSTAGSAAITNSGLVQFGETSTAGSAAITSNNSGRVKFFNTSTAGSATITNNDSSVVQFMNASTAGSATITSNGGSLLFSTTDTTSTATATLNAGALLAGTGSLGNTTINTGATFNPTAAFRINGNLNFGAGSTLSLSVTPITAPLITVTGTATLGGGVQVTPNQRLTAAATYRIIDAAALSGTFSGATISGNFATNPTLRYDLASGDVFLTLGPGLLTPLLPAGASRNVTAVAGAVDNALLAGTSPSAAFASIFNLTGNNLLNGLTQMSGETATGSQQPTFNAMTQFMGLMTDPFTAGRSNGANAPAYAGEEDSAVNAFASSGKRRSKSEREAYAALYRKAPLARNYDPRWSVWAAGFGGSQTTDGNTALGSNTSSSRLFGMAAGADYIFSPRTIAGFALAGGGTSFSVFNGGSGRSDLFQAGAFVRHTAGKAYVTGALAYGWQDVTTDRTVTVAGVDRLRAQFNANAFSGRAEGGYRFVSPWMGGIGIAPYAAGQFTTFELPAYAEQVVSGANTFALAYGSKSVTATRSELGLRADKSFALQTAILTLRGRAAWAHDFNPDRAVGATFQTLPGASFVVNGARQASDAALTTASAEVKWMNGWSATGTFEGEFSSVTRSYAGKGVARYAW